MPKWTPEKLGRLMAEMGCMEPMPCYICEVDQMCTKEKTYLVCRDFSRLLDGLNERKNTDET